MRRGGIVFLAMMLAPVTGAAFLAGCGSDDNGGGGGVVVCDGQMVETGVNQFTLSGTFCDDVNLTSDNEYLLSGGVFIGDGTNRADLTIEAGTTIYGLGGVPPGMLVISRGSRIFANGTQQNPILFTSAQPVGQRGPGDWGGLILNGRSPVNACPNDDCLGEGNSGLYGGNNTADSSGVLRYVRVEFAGHVFTSDDELNGIALQGVGNGTTVEFVQVHQNKDDGIEMFGGTVDLKYCVVSGCVDDQFDWTSGWRGRAQFVVVQMYDNQGDQGIEADNLEANNQATPFSHPTLCNFTFVGGSNNAAEPDIGLLLRRGTQVSVYNSIWSGYWSDGLLDVDDAQTFQNYIDGNLIIRNTILNATNGATTFVEEAGDPVAVSSIFGDQPGNTLADPLLVGPFDTADPDVRPGAGSPALGSFTDPGDTWFDTVTFTGAMGSAAGDDWTEGWTSYPAN